MTTQQKREYYMRFSRFQQSRENTYGPAIRKAIEHQIKQYVHSKNLHSITSDHIHSILKTLYNDAAITYGAKIRSDLIGHGSRKARMPVGFNARMIELVNEYFGTDILNTSEGITQTTKEIIQRVLQQSAIEGLGFSDIVKKLENTELTAARARLIARTETVTAANRGAHIAAKETEIECNKEWLATADNRTRAHHASISGRIVGFDDYFILDDGVKMLVPGDRGGTDGRLETPAGEVCNCRCTTLYIPVENSTRTFAQEAQTPAPIVREIQAAPSYKESKTIKEAEDQLLTLDIKEVNLSKLNIKQANILANRLFEENAISKVSLNKLDTYRNSKSSAGAFYQDHNNTISINASNISKFTPRALETFEQKLEHIKNIVDRYNAEYLNNAKYNQAQVIKSTRKLEAEMRSLQYKIDRGETSLHFTVTEMAATDKEAFELLITHEIAHYRHYKQIGINTNFYFNSSLSISNYGKVNFKEYLAEWYSYYRLKGSDLVPQDLLKLFKNL